MLPLNTSSSVEVATPLASPSPAGEPELNKERSLFPVRSAHPQGPTSFPLASGWFNPLPSGVVGGYPADTGLDISGLELPVHAIAAGTLVYSESGHTLWTGPRDDDNAVLMALDEPVAFGEHRVTHVWYAHLSRLDHALADQRIAENPIAVAAIHIAAGERLGTSGRANGHPHLHLGLLLDGETRQLWGTFLIDSEIRALLKLRFGQRLPK